MAKKPKTEWKRKHVSQRFSVFQHVKEPNLFQLREKKSKDSDLRGQKRRRVHADCLEDAINMAPGLLGFIVNSEDRKEKIRIADAFTKVLDTRNPSQSWRNNWLRSVDRFLAWVEIHHPAYKKWGSLNRQIIREYLGSMTDLAPNTVRLYMRPIIQTAGFMSREDGFSNFAEQLNLSSKLKKPPAEVHIVDVLEFLDWLKENDVYSRWEAPIALQGLAGLAVQEILRLTWNKIDLDRGLIEISGEVKNEYRQRVIPVCSRVVEALRRADDRMKEKPVRLVQEPLVLNLEGEEYADYTSYGRIITRALKRWNEKLRIAPKDFRNALITHAKLNGYDSSLLEQYVGHAPKSVSDTNYFPRIATIDTHSKGQKAALDRCAEIFKKNVLNHLDREITAYYKKKSHENRTKTSCVNKITA